MSTVVSLICLGPSFQKMTHHFLLHGSLWPTNLEKKSEALLLLLCLGFNSIKAYWVIVHDFLSSTDFFQNQHFQKSSFRNTIRECQTLWIQIRKDRMSVLIWVQTVCKVYQQTTAIIASKERIKTLSTIFQ